MSTISVREQLSRQLHELPDDIVNEIAAYFEWSDSQWQALSLSQFLRDADGDVAYSLSDAEEVYQP